MTKRFLPMAAARGLLAVALAFLAVAPSAARAQALRPALHGDFSHYTFALTWQPGFCGTGEGCRPGQPTAALIGLHGLWASRPRELIDQQIPREKWWHAGCDYFHHSDAAPILPDGIRQQLDQVMPHTQGDLLRHEYDKHVQCFGFDPAVFFATELSMRNAIVQSAFANDLVRRAGSMVSHAELVSSFESSFSTAAPRALQLQCGTDRSGHVVLTQLWITLRRDAVDRFPSPMSLIDSPVVQDNCPDRFLVTTW